jgi:diacylglycerol kinase family enzyme
VVGDPSAPPIEVVATTISGSLKDQRKLGRIGPAFERCTRQPVNVHAVDSHDGARALTHRLVDQGARTIVSAGGAGTFNAVLEGCHRDAGLPADLRLAFLRKGSADLIGKMLRIPDDVGAAAAAIVDGLEHDRCVSADVITVESVRPQGEPARRYLVGFGGLGIFGAVPIFTEARWVKLYKGVLGSLFGDYGPFYVGLSLATAWWYVQRARGRVPSLQLELDGGVTTPQRWAAVVAVGGDLGRAFPLGRGSRFGDGVFRVVALPDRGFLQALRQLAAARSGAILETPDRYTTVVRDVRELTVRTVPAGSTSRQAFHPANVDGLAMQAGDRIRFRIADRIELVAGPYRAPSQGKPG